MEPNSPANEKGNKMTNGNGNGGDLRVRRGTLVLLAIPIPLVLFVGSLLISVYRDHETRIRTTEAAVVRIEANQKTNTQLLRDIAVKLDLHEGSNRGQ